MRACAALVAGHRDFASTSRSQALFHDPKCRTQDVGGAIKAHRVPGPFPHGRPVADRQQDPLQLGQHVLIRESVGARGRRFYGRIGRQHRHRVGMRSG